MERLDLGRLSRPHTGIVLGDLVLLPDPLPYNKYRWAGRQILKLLPSSARKAFRTSARQYGLGRCYLDFQDDVVLRSEVYDLEDQWGKPPGVMNSQEWTRIGTEWWNQLPFEIKADCWHFIWRNRSTYIIGNIPRAGISYAVLEDGFIDRVSFALQVHRLSGIKQLGYLTDPVMHYLNGAHTEGTTFSHTRFAHSLDVTVIASCIAWNLGIQGSALCCLQFAGLTHDVLTPAGGDSTKRVSSVALCEDRNYQKVFALPAFADLEERYDLDRDLIFSTIQNQGLLGQILDIADKLAYVARDLPQYLINSEPELAERARLPNEFMKLTSYVKKRPGLCAVWDTFTAIDGQLVCRDAAKLADFLFVRILLFRQFYANPASRYYEMTIIRIALDHLFQSGQVIVERLLTMNDQELEAMIGTVLGCYSFEVSDPFRVGEPGFKTFTTEAAVQEYARGLYDAGCYPLLYENLQPILKRSSDKFLVVARDGSIEHLSTAYPKREAKLRSAEQLDQPWALYWLNNLNKGVSPLFQQLVNDTIFRRFGFSASGP